LHFIPSPTHSLTQSLARSLAHTGPRFFDGRLKVLSVVKHCEPIATNQERGERKRRIRWAKFAGWKFAHGTRELEREEEAASGRLGALLSLWASLLPEAQVQWLGELSEQRREEAAAEESMRRRRRSKRERTKLRENNFNLLRRKRSSNNISSPPLENCKHGGDIRWHEFGPSNFRVFARSLTHLQ